jgi:hypothetical protein
LGIGHNVFAFSQSKTDANDSLRFFLISCWCKGK